MLIRENNAVAIAFRLEKVREMFTNNRRITTREVADDVAISTGSCHEIFSYVLYMKRKKAKFDPNAIDAQLQ